MAADYAQLIRSVSPQGPYYLIGWSLGGLVAHAVATDLQRQGNEIGLLAAVDSYPASAVIGLRGDEDAAPMASELQHELEELRLQGQFDGTLTQRHYDAMIDATRRGPELAAAFVPERYRGRMLLFVASVEGIDRPADAWTPHVDGTIDVHTVHFTHERMLETSPAASIGAVLADELRRLRAQRAINS
jgi:thioesterase domain-containing protein